MGIWSMRCELRAARDDEFECVHTHLEDGSPNIADLKRNGYGLNSKCDFSPPAQAATSGRVPTPHSCAISRSYNRELRLQFRREFFHPARDFLLGACAPSTTMSNIGLVEFSARPCPDTRTLRSPHHRRCTVR